MTSIPHPVGAPDFKFSNAMESDAPNTIHKVDKLDAYLVSYRDGQGKPQVRICFRIPGSDATFMIQERISGSNVVTPTHVWFHKGLVDKIRDRGMERKKPGEVVESA